jgi:CheY-like chemotaxis protein
MMEETLGEIKHDTLDKYLNEIVKGGKRAQKLVEEMLLFGRRESSKMEVVSVNTVLQDTVTLLKGILPSSMVIHVSPDSVNPSILIDPIQLEQIIMNLAINSRDAMEEVGELQIDVKHMSLLDQDNIPGVFTGNTSERVDQCFCNNENQHTHSGDYVVLSVKDTGSGMSKEILNHMFEPFYTNKAVGNGTGLGLAMVYGIMENAKGHIIVETDENKGTLFRLLFKMHETIEKVETLVEVKKVPLNRNKGASILIVDDEESIRCLMTDLFSKNGYDVIECINGEVALNLFKTSPEKYDLVITDQTMPKLTGSELSKQLLAIKPGIPIILCTGYSRTIDEVGAKSIGVHTFLKKPISLKNLLNTVNKTLDKVA